MSQKAQTTALGQVQHPQEEDAKVCKEAYNNYVNSIICPDLQSNPKQFWSHISSKRCDNNGVAPLRGSRGATFTGSRDKSNNINHQLCSVFNRDEDPSTLPDLGTSPFPSIDHIEVSTNVSLNFSRNLTLTKQRVQTTFQPVFLRS